jgi:N-succinyldiaminopimelate aminotransferase
MKSTNPIYTGLPTTIFEVMTRLANQHQAINLGQGFPDVDGPRDVRAVAAAALIDGPNQYPPMMGVAELRKAVARSQKRFFGLDIDWESEVMVTSGATEALSDSINALIEPGDEVVLLEPLYDCYLPLVLRAGATPRLVRLSPPDWRIDPMELEKAFSPNTKAILLNNPMNPAAKLFTEEELKVVADLLQRFDAYAICDEVYEHIVFDGRQHTPLMSLDGMRERCIRIGSAGKTFSLTGWKVGYVTAVPALLDPIAKAHQFTTFTTPPGLQHAVAFGLGKDDAYFHSLSGDLQAKRDRMAAGLARLGFAVADCAATYFVNAGYARFTTTCDDAEFCRRLTVEARVSAVPLSAFYHQQSPSGTIRFCFSKRDDVLDEALRRLEEWIARAFG